MVRQKYLVVRYFNMSSFSLIVGFGAVVAMLRLLLEAQAATRIRWLIAGLITQFGALIGARIGFILANGGYFLSHKIEVFQISKGGLSWPGAVAGLLLFAWIGLRLLRLPGLAGMDLLSRMLLPIAVAVWLAGWQAGVAYGQTLQAGTWWGIQTADETGLLTLRVPVQPAAVLSLFIMMGFCEWMTRSAKRLGLRAAISGTVFSIHSLLFSFMRYDNIQRFFGLRLDSLAAIVLVLASLVWLILVFKKSAPQLDNGETS